MRDPELAARRIVAYCGLRWDRRLPRLSPDRKARTHEQRTAGAPAAIQGFSGAGTPFPGVHRAVAHGARSAPLKLAIVPALGRDRLPGENGKRLDGFGRIYCGYLGTKKEGHCRIIVLIAVLRHRKHAFQHYFERKQVIWLRWSARAPPAGRPENDLGERAKPSKKSLSRN